jgi:hypothetical protein
VRVDLKVYPAECPGCSGAGAHVADDFRPLLGKLILRAETAEEHEQLLRFRAHIRSPQTQRRFEIVFKQRAEPSPNGPVPPPLSIAGVTSSGDEVGELDTTILERIERDLKTLRRERRRTLTP